MKELLKVAGKSESGTAKPMLVTNEGSPIVTRDWRSMVEVLYPETEVRTDTYKLIKSTKVKDYGLISLRILNTLDSDLRMVFCGEYYGDVDNRYLIRDMASNNYIEINIGKGYSIITPDDFPILNYLETLYFQIKAETTPTEGVLAIWGVYKG